MPAQTRTPSSSSFYVRHILRVLAATGIDDLHEPAGISVEALNDPDARIPHERVWEIWRLARERGVDEAIGLRIAQSIGFETLRIFGLSVMLRGTLRDAYQHAVSQTQLVSDLLRMDLEQHPDGIAVVITPDARAMVAVEAIDAGIALIPVLTRKLLNKDDFSPVEVSFTRPAPRDPGPFADLFRCPLRFGQTANRIVVASAALDQPIETGDAGLARVFDRYMADQKTKIEDTFSALVRKHMILQLPNELPQAARIARALNVSVRTLNRRLSEEQTDFRRLLDKTRKDLAAQYLQEEQRTLKEIAAALGFSTPHNFSRAFRRWYGVPPGEYREG